MKPVIPPATVDECAKIALDEYWYWKRRCLTSRHSGSGMAASANIYASIVGVLPKDITNISQ